VSYLDGGDCEPRGCVLGVGDTGVTGTRQGVHSELRVFVIRVICFVLVFGVDLFIVLVVCFFVVLVCFVLIVFFFVVLIFFVLIVFFFVVIVFFFLLIFRVFFFFIVFVILVFCFTVFVRSEAGEPVSSCR
jgi:hypothetical protein